ncbi:hypothetical protein AZF37_04420 [endosymbiont 'TC1' of Trimyema compressum]|uniref:RrF2 family transcriptional regulator n=1 Tax=endosymbiont 'TC1' of Trimyema compressum TaxID=243899 RepID=UPI0007F0EE02|nr:Rrf2 family transcriptional regulator [endosymbiont 'TC1' of Trimyema compressum]AMP20512.1 hypothetical protein AZF37_04420 [endosymbiont 'TC1' of Trimyema compressum]
MKLSTKGKYGLIAMTDLGKSYIRDNEEYIPLGSIANNRNISEAYLERLIAKLKRAGFVKTQRGALGGYCLAVSPNNITVSELLAILEGPLDVCGCGDNKSESCDTFDSCVSRVIGDEIAEKIREVIDHMTLDDLIKKQEVLEKRRNDGE